MWQSLHLEEQKEEDYFVTHVAADSGNIVECWIPTISCGNVAHKFTSQNWTFSMSKW